MRNKIEEIVLKIALKEIVYEYIVYEGKKIKKDQIRWHIIHVIGILGEQRTKMWGNGTCKQII